MILTLDEIKSIEDEARAFAELLARATGQDEWRSAIETALPDFGRLHAELDDLREKVPLAAVAPLLALLRRLEDDDG